MAEPPYFPLVRVVLPVDDDWSRLCWYGFAADHACVGEGVEAPAAIPAAGQLEILLPARRVAIHQLSLPAAAGKHLAALIEQGLEDRLLGDRGDVVALPGPPAGGDRRVWVCSRRWLAGGLERLAAAGRHPARLLPEYELLPEMPAASTFAEVAGGTIFRSAGGQFGIVDDPAVLAELSGGGVLQRVVDLRRRATPAPCPAGLPKALMGFDRAALDPRQLRQSFAWLGLALVLLLLAEGIHWRQLEQRESRLQHEIRQTFASAFPGTPIVDPSRQWESRRRDAGAGQDDAFDAVVRLAGRLDALLHPRRIEVANGVVQLTLADGEAARFAKALAAAGPVQTTPGDHGLTRLRYRLDGGQR